MRGMKVPALARYVIFHLFLTMNATYINLMNHQNGILLIVYIYTFLLTN